MENALEQGRASFERQAWAEAYAQLTDAGSRHPLEPEDLYRLAVVAYLLGKDAECTDLLTRAHNEYLSRGEVEQAVRCAFWLGYALLRKGDAARGGGWLARAQRLLDECGRECVEQGYLLIPLAIRSVMEGDPARGYELFARAGEISEQFGDRDLAALSLVGRGRALIRQGDVDGGAALLDEVMAGIEAGDAGPIVAGDVYCTVIEACQEIFDMRRAQEWTEALTQWCEAQPDLVPFRGQCQIRRAEILQLHGEWPHALEEAERACERLTRPPGEAAAGAAFYQKAELHRLRGEFDEAEEAYRQAGNWMRNPRPGLALLRLAQGDVDAARAAISRVMDSSDDRFSRSRALPPYVDIMLCAGELDAARTAVDELSSHAADSAVPFLTAVASQAEGSVRLAEGDPDKALEALRQAWSAWMELEAPYEAARVRVLLGLACRQLGDHEGARMDFEAARALFESLGAAPDLARLEVLSERAPTEHGHGLTPRELEVLRLVAVGETNKGIAGDLFISERTVERHLSNIFSKLDVPSRTAAAAYAFEHGLVK